MDGEDSCDEGPVLGLTQILRRSRSGTSVGKRDDANNGSQDEGICGSG